MCNIPEKEITLYKIDKLADLGQQQYYYDENNKLQLRQIHVPNH